MLYVNYIPVKVELKTGEMKGRKGRRGGRKKEGREERGREGEKEGRKREPIAQYSATYTKSKALVISVL